MRKFQQQKEEKEEKRDVLRFGPKPLPLAYHAAVYARQSTKGQFVNHTESADAQTVDLIALAKRLGWQNEEDIVLFIENIKRDGKIGSASGRLRIDQREGLQALVDRIEKDEIKAVIVTYEDRLFRDETQIQVNVFIDICKRHHTLVITPFRRYDFQDPLDTQMFRMRCEQAAAFLHDYVERLHDYKKKVSERGEYDGRSIAIGYIVDRRKKITVDGREEENPTYKRYIPYEPHAKVIRWIFRRYRELSGNLPALCREIRFMPVVFPPFEEWVDARDITKCRSLPVEGGYRPTRRGIVLLLTNVVYLGYWIHENVIVSKTNHLAIVDEEDFWYAFNSLNDYSPDGEEIQRVKRSTRHAKEVTPANSALLLERITSDIGPVYVVGTSRGINYYAACEQDARYGLNYKTAFAARDLEQLAVEKLLEHLETETHLADYRRMAEEAQVKIQQATTLLKAELKETERQLAGVKASLLLPPDELDEETRREFARKLKTLKGIHEAVEKKLHQTQSENSIADLFSYDELIKEMRVHWPKLPFADKKRLANAFILRVVMRELAPHWLQIDFEWKTPSWGIDSAIIWRASGTSTAWTPQENDLLREHYLSTDRKTLLQLLPRRSYRAIYFQAVRVLELPKVTIPNNTPVCRSISWLDYLFMEENGFVYDSGWSSKEVLWLVLLYKIEPIQRARPDSP